MSTLTVFLRPDMYKSDDDPGYRCLSLHPLNCERPMELPSIDDWKPLYDWEEVRYWKRKQALQMAQKVNERDYIPKPPVRGKS